MTNHTLKPVGPILKSVFFKGNAPRLDAWVFNGDHNATIYYLPGTAGWDKTFGGRPTVIWNQQTNATTNARSR